MQVIHLTCSTFEHVEVGHICKHDLTIHQSNQIHIFIHVFRQMAQIMQISNICLPEKNFGKPQMLQLNG